MVLKHGYQTWLLRRVFGGHFYLKQDCIAENIHQWNAKVSGVSFFVIDNFTSFLLSMTVLVTKLFSDQTLTECFCEVNEIF